MAIEAWANINVGSNNNMSIVGLATRRARGDREAHFSKMISRVQP